LLGFGVHVGFGVQTAPIFVGTINGALVCVIAAVIFLFAGMSAVAGFPAMYVLCYFWHLCCCTRLRESLALFKSFNTLWYGSWSSASGLQSPYL
jgi:hypothetical protein